MHCIQASIHIGVYGTIFFFLGGHTLWPVLPESRIHARSPESRENCAERGGGGGGGNSCIFFWPAPPKSVRYSSTGFRGTCEIPQVLPGGGGGELTSPKKKTRPNMPEFLPIFDSFLPEFLHRPFGGGAQCPPAPPPPSPPPVSYAYASMYVF